MLTVLALTLLAATAATTLARPPEPSPAWVRPLESALGPQRQRAPIPEAREYLLPRFLLPHFLGYDESPRMPPPQRPEPNHDWLNKEIDRINQMEDDDEPVRPHDDDLAHWIARDPYLQDMFQNSVKTANRYNAGLDPPNTLTDKNRHMPHPERTSGISSFKMSDVNKRLAKEWSEKEDNKKVFALTPLDKGYFEPEPNAKSQQDVIDTAITGEGPIAAMVIEPPRQTRQNPNLSRTKTLVTENIEKLRSGLNTPQEVVAGVAGGAGGASGAGERGREQVRVEAGVDPVVFAAVGGAVAAALSLTVFGFTFAWYTLAKKAKAAADVDYPAYGVTGPTVDCSGDRKLAHSAHMYHYQHQKQQIIAMERMDLEQRLGSVSDPESEEENEEGDYTVYECPGFATTGDMEVKNPLFSDEPTPATPATPAAPAAPVAPASCEEVKPQPTE